MNNAIAVSAVIAKDFAYAARAFRKAPAFTFTVILTLGLAIGGTAAMFTLIRTVLLKPLAYRGPDQLVRISGGASSLWFESIQGAHSFVDTAAFAGQENLTLTGQGEPEVLAGARVSADFLSVLGVAPQLGRSFLPEEDVRGGRAVAMISYELWNRRFSGKPETIGETANFGATPYTIVGVLPPGFDFPFAGLDVWLTSPDEWPLMTAKSRALSPFLTIVGLLRPGVNLEQANAELVVLHHQYATAHPAMLDAKPKSEPRIVLMKEQLVGKIRSLLWMLFGAVGFVLLIACSNVATLLLARGASRSQEFAIRAALGASRARLISQLLAESVLLSSAGGIVGVLLAMWSLRAVPGMTAFDLPRSGEIRIDGLVLLFAAAVSIGTGLVFGLVPSLAASQPDLFSVLRASGVAASQSIAKRVLSVSVFRGLFVVSQIALSVILLIGAGLLLKSVARLHQVDVGFNTKNLLTARVSLPPARYSSDQKKTLFFDRLLRETRSSPGVRGASVAMFLPMTGFVGSPVQDASKPPLKLNERTIATLLVVAPDYFRTLEIPMRRGRDFSEVDSQDSHRVAIIDEGCARHFWPSYPAGQDPIGRYLLIGGVDPHPAQIVGIAASVHQNLENTGWPETVYVAFAQNPQPSAMLAIRTAGEPFRFANAIRQNVRRVDREQPISALRTMDDLLDAEVGQRSLILALLGSFSAAALLLAVIGIYGVVSYSVVQRTREVGIRRALGAQHGDILQLVVGRGLWLALAGVAAGTAAAAVLTRVIKSLLFGVSATDPAIFLAISISFVLVAVAASYFSGAPSYSNRSDVCTTA